MTNLYNVSVEIPWSLSDFGKCCAIKFKNHLATLVETYLSKGGLKHMMLGD